MPRSPRDRWHGTKKRGTQPKTKGCYECSQRRISCDRGQPSCYKCITKGLQCSGLGVRYRFENGIASRGKFVGKSMHDALYLDKLPPTIAKNSLSDRPVPTPETSDPIAINPPIIHSILEQALEFECAVAGSMPSRHYLQAECTDKVLSHSLAGGRVNVVDHWKEFFLNYFSINIAPQMLAIDGTSNGWRYLVLPISIADDVVMSAVVAASAYHVSVRATSMLQVAEKSYTQAINGLFRRRDLRTCDHLLNCYSVLTILLLLIKSMVTGCSDFPILFRMLKSAVEAVGDEEGLGSSELGLFLQRQIRKFRVYAEPLLGETSGVETILSRASESFDCLHYCSKLYPEHSLAVFNIKSQIQQAYNIYLRRALGNIDVPSSIQLVERFKRTAEGYPPGSPGEQVLIWASFIAAAESSTLEHRVFFIERFEAFYDINGFRNNLKALTLLKSIWQNMSGTKWTTMLPYAQTFIM